MAALNRIPNEMSLKRTFIGFELNRGIVTVPDFKLYGDLTITDDRPLVEVPEYDGSYDGDIDPVFGPMVVGGTYAQPLTYEDGPPLMELGVRGGVAGVSDAKTIPGYLWEYSPNRFRDDLASATIEHGFPGMPKLAEQVMVNDWTISADIDDSEAVWKFSSNIWARANALKPSTLATATAGTTTTATVAGASWTVNQWAGAYVTWTSGANKGEALEVASNTATVLTFVSPLPNAVIATDAFEISGVFTAGIPDRNRERISAPGTKLYEADMGATLVNFQTLGQFISFSLTHNNAITGKRFMEDVDRMSRKVGRGKRVVTGQIRREFDTRKQRDNWLAQKPQQMRIEQLGSVIDTVDPTTKMARIDLNRIFWGTPTEDARGSNLTLTMPFRAYLDAGTGQRVKYSFKNKIATMF